MNNGRTISFRNPATEQKQELSKLKKFSSFLYNDSPVGPEYSSGGTTEDDRTPTKVENDLNFQVEVNTLLLTTRFPDIFRHN